MLTFDIQEKIIAKLLRMQQNAFCADCNNKYPCCKFDIIEGASLDFGVFICTNCSGAHRALGPSITRVKSNKLDAWHSDWIQNMSLGNSLINEYWEQNIGGYKKPTIQSSLDEIKRFVVEKYVKKKFANSSGIDPLTAFKTGQKIPKKKVQQATIEVKIEIKPKQIKKVQNQFFDNFGKQQQKKKVQFDPFQMSHPPKPKKVQVNLLDFPQKKNQTNKASQKHSFDEFNFFELNDKSHPNSRKDQFNSFSGKNAKSSTTGHITFDDLLESKGISNNLLFNMPKQQTNNRGMGINFGAINPNQFVTLQSNQLNFNTMNIQQSNNNFLQSSTKVPQQITMNINMNMYPNVMNINMINNAPPVSDNISLKPNNKITMQIKNHQKPKTQVSETKSWVDEWK